MVAGPRPCTYPIESVRLDLDRLGEAVQIRITVPDPALFHREPPS